MIGIFDSSRFLSKQRGSCVQIPDSKFVGQNHDTHTQTVGKLRNQPHQTYQPIVPHVFVAIPNRCGLHEPETLCFMKDCSSSPQLSPQTFSESKKRIIAAQLGFWLTHFQCLISRCCIKMRNDDRSTFR